MEAAFHFVSPATDAFNFAMTDVDAHFYPLTDAAKVCVREAAPPSATPVGEGSAQPCRRPCIASGTIDQMYGGPHDGRWQRALSAVPLVLNQSYEFSVTWDAMRGGYAAVDALLIESTTLYNGDELAGAMAVVGPMDSRIFVKGG
jgi:hypothetical protein